MNKSILKTIAVTAVVPLAAFILNMGYQKYYQAAYPVQYTQEVAAASEDTGLPESLIYSVIRTESGFRPGAESSVGAKGLMQITPDTLSWVRYRIGEAGAAPVELLFEPEANITYGAHTLALLVEEFGSIDTALAAYHAGFGNVKNWLTDAGCSPDGKSLSTIPFGDTSRYVAKVLSTAEMYRRVYHKLS